MENEIKGMVAGANEVKDIVLKVDTEAKKNEIPFINIMGERTQKALLLGDTGTDTKAKIGLYNEIINCQENISSHFNEECDLQCIYLDKRKAVDKDGKEKEVILSIFFQKNGKAWYSTSSVIYESVKKLIDVFGVPPYEFKVKFVAVDKGKIRIYNIEICN